MHIRFNVLLFDSTVAQFPQARKIARPPPPQPACGAPLAIGKAG